MISWRDWRWSLFGAFTFWLVFNTVLMAYSSFAYWLSYIFGYRKNSFKVPNLFDRSPFSLPLRCQEVLWTGAPWSQELKLLFECLIIDLLLLLLKSSVYNLPWWVIYWRRMGNKNGAKNHSNILNLWKELI